MNDVLEIIERGKVEALTGHLNGIDKTNSIKFTHEPEKNGQIQFLDTLITRREGGSIKLLIYTQENHTYIPVPVVSNASSASAQTCCHRDVIGKE